MASVMFSVVVLLSLLPLVSGGSYCTVSGSWTYCAADCCTRSYFPYGRYCCQDVVRVDGGAVAGGVVSVIIFFALVSVGFGVYKKKTTITRVSAANTTTINVTATATSGSYPV